MPFDNHSGRTLVIFAVFQNTFTDVVFAREGALYKSEGIAAKDIEFTANSDVISVLVDKANSVLSILEDQCLAPGNHHLTSSSRWCLAVNGSCNKIIRLIIPGGLCSGGNDEKLVSGCCSKLKACPRFVPAKLDAQSAFNIKHTIGAIKYNAQGFIFKNKDVLRPEMVEVVQVRLFGFSHARAATKSIPGI